ncbi:MAG TPA: methyltransferase domain-containing protein [Nitrosopumilaceae archaeon]|nr:methyltransferase domain-containing protein [Nitrosopumilaceae archaeon]
MHQFSLKYLRCVNCYGMLDIEILEQSYEIEEGFLICNNCNNTYPIISKIPILYSNFTSYFSNRTQLGGYLMTRAKNEKIKSFVKNSLGKIKNSNSDVTPIEKRWVATYKNSIKSKFYSHIKNSLDKFSKTDLALEHGCSIGYVTKYLAKKHDIVFGIDQSFFAILEAKQNNFKNLDFFVANSLNHPFGKNKFGLIVGLNLLELVEPQDLLNVLSKQASDVILISDPYDFERGTNSVKHTVDSKSLRSELEKRGFVIIQNTKKPKFLPWKLNINSRLDLHYKVDLIIAKNNKKRPRG